MQSNDIFFFRSVQMRLYSLNKRRFVLVFIVFFACFGISFLVGIAGMYLDVACVCSEVEQFCVSL